jgi:hypothetical protein
MTSLTPAMDTALQQRFATVFGALKVQLPDRTICLLDGASTVTFGGHTYTGRDSLFGILDSVDVVKDGTGDTAPSMSITLLPDGNSDAATICSPTFQGSSVELYIGAISPDTGEVIPSPLLIFSGELDQPVLTVDQGTRELEFECASAFERLFSGDEGIRLSDAHHKSVWPGETGLSQVTGIQKTVYWGVDKPAGSITYGNGGFSGGSDGFHGGGSIINGYAQL